MADASVLGIHPPATVRIDLDGWVQDWPWDAVQVLNDRITVSADVAQLPDTLHPGASSVYEGGRRTFLFYPYEHAQACCTAHATGRFFPPVRHPFSWIFHGRESFTVTAGPAQPLSMDSAAPVRS